MIDHHVGDDTEWPRAAPVGREDGDEIAEQPRPAEAAAPDDHPVATGGPHHRHGVRGLPDVAVAEHRDRRDVRLELADGVPRASPA